MNSTVILAVAGGRKTQQIVECCSSNAGGRRLVLTFATTGQDVLLARLRQSCLPEQIPEVTGWFAFLLNHVVKPYLPDRFPGVSVSRLHYVEGGDPSRGRRGVSRYIDDEGRAYSHRLGKLAFDVAVASCGAAIDRLEGIFDEIYIDEVQDLTGNDLDILELLMRSRIKIILVGDVRQSIFETSRSDTKHAKFKKLNKVEWFRDAEKKNLCRIEYRTETWRCNQSIIDFADSVIPDRLGLPPTKSHQKTVTGHDGIFVVNWSHLKEYIERFKPEALRNRIDAPILDGTSAINFGQAKGITVDRVLIYPTKPMEDFLLTGATLADESAARLYVAATRAKYSVAFVVEDTTKHSFQVWDSNSYAS